MIKNTLNDTDFGKRDKRGNWAPFGKLPINPKYLLPFNPFKFIFYLISELWYLHVGATCLLVLLIINLNF